MLGAGCALTLPRPRPGMFARDAAPAEAGLFQRVSGLSSLYDAVLHWHTCTCCLAMPNEEVGTSANKSMRLLTSTTSPLVRRSINQAHART